VGLIITDERTETLAQAYGSGKGRVRMRARVLFEEMNRGRKRIIVSELPYMTNKASLIEKIAEYVREGTLDGVSDLRDESDRQGMRIVIELSKISKP
jgi:DNA gyrase subunit A